MKQRISQFMYGRYGQDDLGKFITIFVLGMYVISFLTNWTALYMLSMLLLLLNVVRMFSKNIYKRGQENQQYLRLRGKVKTRFTNSKARFTQRKTHCFFKCPSCKAQLRVPKGRGKIAITCPKCKARFEKTT